MLTIDQFEYFLTLQRDINRLIQSANSESFTADDALAQGDLLKAEQHQSFSRAYRERAALLQNKLDALTNNDAGLKQKIALELRKRESETSLST